MEFKHALDALKKGEMITRDSWYDSFVFMQIPSIIDKEIIPRMQALPQSVKDEFIKRNIDFISYNNQLVIVNELNSISGWNPSIADIMAGDWLILE